MKEISFFDEEFKSAFWSSLVMVLNGIIIGFSVALANLILEPILLSIDNLGFEGFLSMFISIIILFILLMIFALILILLNKKASKYKK